MTKKIIKKKGKYQFNLWIPLELRVQLNKYSGNETARIGKRVSVNDVIVNQIKKLFEV